MMHKCTVLVTICPLHNTHRENNSEISCLSKQLQSLKLYQGDCNWCINNTHQHVSTLLSHNPIHGSHDHTHPPSSSIAIIPPFCCINSLNSSSVISRGNPDTQTLVFFVSFSSNHSATMGEYQFSFELIRLNQPKAYIYTTKHSNVCKQKGCQLTDLYNALNSS